MFLNKIIALFCVASILACKNKENMKFSDLDINSCITSSDSVIHFNGKSYGCSNFHLEKILNEKLTLCITTKKRLGNYAHIFIDTCFITNDTNKFNITLYKMPDKRFSDEKFNSIRNCSDLYFVELRDPIPYEAEKFNLKVHMYTEKPNIYISALADSIIVNMNGKDSLLRNQLFYKVKLE